MRELLNKASLSRENFEEVNILMEECKGILDEQPEKKQSVSKFIEIIRKFIDNQDCDGFWRLICSENMPFEAKIDFWKYPTIVFASIMINFKLKHSDLCIMINGFDETLERALDVLERGKLVGHGFDSFNFTLNALKILLQAGVMEFIKLYPDKNKSFAEIIHSKKADLEKSIKEGKTQFDYNENFKLRMVEILNMMNGKKEAYLFVYGTLMKNNRAWQSYLGDAVYMDESILFGYSLYDLGYYPGIVEDKDGKVKGELYIIPQDKLSQIDIYEGEGTLYKRKMVKVDSKEGGVIDAYAYIYTQSVTDKTKIQFRFQPWTEGVADTCSNYVWYACYGSNINKERFMKYIMGGCKDKTPPSDELPIILKHPIYFSNHSSRWDNKGVAFLDVSKKGRSYGKLYLITKEQFGEIHRQEGKGPDWYNEKVDLGFIDGIPIQTITHSPRFSQDVIPSIAYFEIIKKGIKETYPKLKDANIDAYLIKKCLSGEKINVLSYIRNQEHGVTIRNIAENMNTGMKSIVEIIRDLKETGLIKQDGRSIRAGIAWDATEAIYYTMPDRRAAIDKVL